MKLSLTVQTPEVLSPSPVSLLSGTFEERLSKAASFGFQGLELLPLDPVALEPDVIRSGAERAGLELAAIGTVLKGFAGQTLIHPNPEVAARARGWLTEAIAFAGAVGAPLVTIGGFRGRVSSADDGPDQLAVILRNAAEHAKTVDVRLALEPINHFQGDFVNTAAEVLDFLDRVDHPSVGLLLDTCHMNIDESSWDEPFHRAMAAGKLWHIHVADNNRLAPGRGLIDFAKIIDVLRQIRYSGYLSAEILARPDPDSAARDTISHLGPLLAQS